MKTRQMVLKTRRLVLKALTDCDYLSLIQMATDPLVNATYMFPELKKEEEKQKLFARLKTLSQMSDAFLYGIYFNDELIGIINKVFADEATVEVGYFIKSTMWNQGFAQEALAKVIEELFALGFKVIKAGHFIENPASGRVMEKCGMHKTQETEDLTYRGQVHHCIYYQIEKEE